MGKLEGGARRRERRGGSGLGSEKQDGERLAHGLYTAGPIVGGHGYEENRKYLPAPHKTWCVQQALLLIWR